jgi:hypothetical protein
MVLGNLPSKSVSFDTKIQLPAYIPQQKIEMIDVKTGQKKTFNIDNINALINLIQQGFNLYSSIQGGTGKGQVVYQPTPLPPKQAGFGKIATVIGGVAAAYVLFSLLMSKR